MAEKFEYTREWTDAEAFPLLGFTRSWENPEDYPTIELDETQVRKDMQSLHDEVKNYINDKLIPAVLAEDATEAARAAAEAQRETNETQRIENENARIAAEQARVDETSGVVAQANQAAQSWAVGGTGTREGEDTNNAKYWSEQAAAAAGGGVTSFKGRTGSVTPASGDYTAEMVGAYSKEETNTLLQKKADSGHTHDDRYYTETEVNDLLSEKAPAYTYGTEDLTAGTSTLETGKLYFVYE